DEFIPPTGYGDARIAVFAVVVLTAAAVIAVARKPYPLLIIVAASLTLPLTEALTGGIFAYLFVLALLFWLARSVRAGLLYYWEIRTNPSALSVKNAVDSLHTGVMLYDKDGFIALSNTQMQRLMMTITGKIQRNGKRFQNLLAEGTLEPSCRITSFEGHDVCLLPDDTAWIFTTNELVIGRKQYMQATATEISERWKLIEDLRLQNEMLTQRRNELNETIDNLHILSRERETQKARMRAHDILGERLTLMLRAVRDEQALDHAMLRTLSGGLLDKLKTDQGEPSPADSLDIMKREFETIGVKILLDGCLPADDAMSRLFVDIIREAVTNAVRHGLATQVCIRIADSDNGDRLEITNNGYSRDNTIKEGGGIAGMREKIKSFGGALNVTAHPHFMLVINFSGGGGSV
ncbi:MAG: hypothetical protein LBH28_02025, partial [Oscillospiraceae bacterium]|nr:hypothetical protein [Oscillospiraceae bacterium]